MGAIDKTYVDKDELKEAVTWCRNVGVAKLENGYRFKPINFIYHYNDLDDPDFDWNRDEYILWNTPIWFDRWLWINCPLSFVRERLVYQYGEAALEEFKNWEYSDPKNNLDLGKQHYKFLKTPKWRGHKWFMRHGRRKNPWPGKCAQQTYFINIESPNFEVKNDLTYCKQLDTWVERHGFLAGGNEYVWQHYHNNPPTKKSIIRELRKWYIPKGYIVKVYNLKYRDMDFKILVK